MAEATEEEISTTTAKKASNLFHYNGFMFKNKEMRLVHQINRLFI